MNRPRPAASRIRWLAAGGAGVLVTLGTAFLLLPLGRGPGAAAPGMPPLVVLAPPSEGAGGRLVGEQFQLLDPTPLYLPTSWNYGGAQRLPPGVRRHPEDVFADFPPRHTYPVSRLDLPLPHVGTPPADAVEVAVREFPDRFEGLGRGGVAPAPFEPRRARIEVVSLMDGSRVLDEDIREMEGLPEAGLWRPAEFSVAVDRSGALAQPFLAGSSGSAEIDQFLLGFLDEGWHVGKRLAPGIYRVFVGP